MSELSNLAKLADSQNVQMHKTARTAAVAWFGYTVPQPTVTSAASRSTSPASQECAVEGGEQLVQFCQLLPGGKTTTLIGHSYGSVVVSQALRTARTKNVNIAEKVVFVGSPGLGVDDLSVLGVKPGNVFLLEGTADPVAGLGWFEKDPDQLVGITELSTQEHGTLTSSKFHSRYLKSGTTSQHNIAAVICGNATIPRTGDTVGTRIGRGIKMPIRRLARAYRPEKTQTPDM